MTMRPADKGSVQSVHRRLEYGEPVSDHEILALLAQVSIMSNAETVAIVALSTVAPICAFRPHLAPELFPHVLNPLVAMGFETSDRVINWLRYYLDHPEPYAVIGVRGASWIRDLITNPRIIQNMLDHAMRANDLVMMQETLARFSPHLRVPIDQVDLYYYWSEERLKSLKNAILFFCLEASDETEEAIPSGPTAEAVVEKLTATLAHSDSEHLIRLLIFDLDGYLSFQHRYVSSASCLHGIDKDAQIIWVYQGEVVYSMLANQIDFATVELNTRDLLERIAR
jgi:hypothetical protein